MEDQIESYILKSLYNEQSHKYEKKTPKDELFCNFCKKHYQRSGRTCHEKGLKHIKKMSEFKKKLSKFVKNEIYGTEVIEKID